MAREAAARESALIAERQAAQEKLEGQVREARESEQRARYDAVSKLKEEWEGERRSHEEALAKLRSELETDKAIALAALEGDLRQQWDGRAAEAMRVADEEQNRLKQEVSRAWEEARGAAERVSARERELEEQLQAALLAQKVNSRGALRPSEPSSNLVSRASGPSSRRGLSASGPSSIALRGRTSGALQRALGRARSLRVAGQRASDRFGGAYRRA